MNTREKYLTTCRFEPGRRIPRWEFGFWAGTLQRWYAEGLPGGGQRARIMELNPADWISADGVATFATDGSGADEDVHRCLRLDPGMHAVEINYGPAPMFEIEVLEEGPGHKIWRDENGVVLKALKPSRGMPEFVDYPVHGRREWEQFKAERYRPVLRDRLPPNWPRRREEYSRREFPLCLGASNGFFGTVRNFVGAETALMLFYDDPAWMHEMMNHLGDVYAALYDAVLNEVDVDSAVFWEDMCYVAGPLISPALFHEFMHEPYRKVTDVLRDHGVRIILVDTDGDHRQLIEPFLQAGVSGFYPFEVQSHMDVRAIRGLYPDLIMQGGIDKKALAAGRQAIDRELERIIPVVRTGGYIPHVDHAIPPDVSWENFCYYRRALDAMLDECESERA